MNWLKNGSFILLFCTVCSAATHVAVLETVADGAAKDSVSFTDRQFLTNVLREQAVKELPAKQNYIIMTRENISAMLPPGKTIEECEGSCLAETGRNIAADYVCQARVGRFGSKLTLTAELYETAGNKLIASFNSRGVDVEELLKIIEEKSPEFFRNVKELNAFEPSSVLEKIPMKENDSAQRELDETATDSVRADAATVYDDIDGKMRTRIGENISVDANDESENSRIHWIPISISTVAIVVGTVLAVVGNNKAKNAVDKGVSSKSDYEKNKNDAKFGQTLRSVGLGLAIVGGLGLGLSFSF